MSQGWRCALHQRENGAFAQCFLAACDHRRHFYGGFGFAFLINTFRLHMLGRIFPDSFDLMQTAGLNWRILGRDRYPMKGHFLGCVGDTRNVAYILQFRCSPLARLNINDFDAATIRAHKNMIAVQGQILIRITCRQGIDRRADFQRRLNQFPFGFHDFPFAVHVGSVCCPNIQRIVPKGI